MDKVSAATIGANLEKDFENYSNMINGGNFTMCYAIFDEESKKYVQHEVTLIVEEVMTFSPNEAKLTSYGVPVNVNKNKGIILKDLDGNIYVHYNGTVDGTWEQNSPCYGGPPSQLQNDSLDFFNKYIENNHINGRVYLSGHSQGGNSAQYVAYNTPYGDHIEMCISLDGPNLSEDAKAAVIEKYGMDYYLMQYKKNFGFYGAFDYVSTLGECSAIPPGNIEFVGNSGDFHRIEGMMKGNGLNKLLTDDSDFRKLVSAFNNHLVANVSSENKQFGSSFAMKIAEVFFGNEYFVHIDASQFEEFKQILFPLMVSFLREHPDMIYPALISIKMDPETAKLIEKVIYELNNLPEEQCNAILDALGECIIITPDGKLDFSADAKEISTALALALPTILNVAKENPDLLWNTIQQFGIDELLAKHIKENPFRCASIALIFVLVFPFIKEYLTDSDALLNLVENVFALIDSVNNILAPIKEFIHNVCSFITEAVTAIIEYNRHNSPGGKYVSNHPHFRADTELLREYANRLCLVNARLVSLDKALNDLYLQVGLLDIDDILRANLIIGHSWRITKCQTYLSTAADTLETADKQAVAYLGG